MAFEADITTTVSATAYLPTEDAMCLGNITVTDTALLGTMNLIFRWTKDSVSRSKTISLLLTVLGNDKSFIFPIRMDPDTGCTWETSLSGVTGSFSAHVSCIELGI